MEEKYLTLNFCLLSSGEKKKSHSYIATMEFLSTFNTEESVEQECGRSTSVKSQFSPTSCKAELLTLCIIANVWHVF